MGRHNGKAVYLLRVTIKKMPGPAVQTELASQEIPDKLYFRIGDVSRIAGVKPYVLRYWESEFPSLGPKKSGTNHRLYRRKDVELVLEIKRLLYEKRFTIEGARNFLSTKGKPLSAAVDKKQEKPRREQKAQAQLFPTEDPMDRETIRSIAADLRDLLKSLR